ncbi:MAG: DUF4920 domain-containing protein [Brumimicrobium sp.]|nr:DUF4920 domain-containing protein [Brumimicrobium sp.]
MKLKIGILVMAMIVLVACSTNTNEVETTEENVAEQIDLSQYENFGASFTADEYLTMQEMQEKYHALEVGDSVEVTFLSTVNSVCQKKGCWMKLDLGGEDELSFVRFKDYEFFVPKDAEGANAVVKGWAHKEEISVEELRHYAKDAGKSDEEIDAITEPKTEYTFLAEGVFLKKNEDAE